MRNYRDTAATETRLDYGIELVQGLSLFPETAPLANDFQPVQDQLETAYEARRAKRKPLVAARVAMRLASFLLRQTIRSGFKAAEIADDGRRGPICSAVFPDGLSAVVSPKGARFLEAAEDLRDRLAKTKLPAAAAYRTAWLSKIDGPLVGLRKAADQHKTAKDEYLDAFREELAQRGEHRRYVDKIAGAVREAFPGDRARQDVVFPVPDDGEPAHDNAPAAPAAPTPAAPTNGTPTPA